MVAGKMLELNESTTLPLPQLSLDGHCVHCSSMWLRVGWPHTCSQGQAWHVIQAGQWKSYVPLASVIGSQVGI